MAHSRWGVRKRWEPGGGDRKKKGYARVTRPRTSLPFGWAVRSSGSTIKGVRTTEHGPGVSQGEAEVAETGPSREGRQI